MLKIFDSYLPSFLIFHIYINVSTFIIIKTIIFLIFSKFLNLDNNRFMNFRVNNLRLFKVHVHNLYASSLIFEIPKGFNYRKVLNLLNRICYGLGYSKDDPNTLICEDENFNSVFIEIDEDSKTLTIDIDHITKSLNMKKFKHEEIHELNEEFKHVNKIVDFLKKHNFRLIEIKFITIRKMY